MFTHFSYRKSSSRGREFYLKKKNSSNSIPVACNSSSIQTANLRHVNTEDKINTNRRETKGERVQPMKDSKGVVQGRIDVSCIDCARASNCKPELAVTG